jgi:hypothetical protein
MPRNATAADIPDIPRECHAVATAEAFHVECDAAKL